MIEFVKQLVALVKPYRVRLILGILIGILAGFMEPLAIAVFTGVFQLIFSPGTASMREQPKVLPHFVRDNIPPAVWE